MKSELVLTSRLDSFARLTEAQLKRLTGLQRQSAQVSEVMVAGNRLLWSLPAAHPLGALKLVLVDDNQGRLVALDPVGHKKYELHASRLPDLLEGGTQARRSRHSMTLEPDAAHPVRDKDSALLHHRMLKMEAWSAQIGLRQASGPRGIREADLRIKAKLWTAAGPAKLPHRESLLSLALPLLLGQRGLPLLEYLSHRMGRPLLGWELSITGEVRGRANSIPAVERTTVLDRGWLRVPLCQLSTTRPAYKATPGEPGFSAAGKQLIPPEELTGLRTATAASKDPGPAGPLTVDNHTPAVAMVYVDGMLLGWVAPHRKHSFKGFTRGFYRVYARSPLGTESWGPFDTYVPGPVVLRL